MVFGFVKNVSQRKVVPRPETDILPIEDIGDSGVVGEIFELICGRIVYQIEPRVLRAVEKAVYGLRKDVCWILKDDDGRSKIFHGTGSAKLTKFIVCVDHTHQNII
jgi:hypothetical protein